MIENRLTGTCMQRIVIIVKRGHGVPAQPAPRGAERGRLMATAIITRKSALATMIEVVRKAPDAVLTVAPDVDLKDLEDVLVRMHKSASKARKSSAPSKTTLANATLIDEKVVPFVLAHGTAKAKDLVAADELPEIATPQRAGALLGRAVALGKLSSNPFVEKGGKTYAAPDHVWSE